MCLRHIPLILTKILSRPEKSEHGNLYIFIEFLMEFSTLSTIEIYFQKS